MIRLGKIEFERWYSVRIVVRGEKVRCLIDGEEVFEQLSNPFSRGRVGLASWDAVARFRDIKITTPDGRALFEGVPRLPDGAASAPPADARRRWVHAKGNFTLVDVGRWDEWSPRGRMYHWREVGRSDEYVELDAIDGNTSLRARLHATRCDYGEKPRLDFRTIFEGRWAEADGIARKGIGPFLGDWEIVGDQLLNRGGDGFKSILFGDPGWKDVDYSFEARNAPGHTRSFCALFRAASANEYFSFLVGIDDPKLGKAMEARRYYIGGNDFCSPRVQIRPAFESNHWYKIGIVARGKHFICSVDGKKAVEFDLDYFGSGRVGIESFGEGQTFRNLKVTSPDGTILWEGVPELR